MHRVRFPNMTADEGPVVGFVGLGAMGSGMAKVIRVGLVDQANWLCWMIRRDFHAVAAC